MLKPDEGLQTDAADSIEKEIRSFTRHSPMNRMPTPENDIIFDEPLVQYADGDDPIFTEYKSIIHPSHLTPREAIARALNKSQKDLPTHLSVISWILPITSKTRASNRQRRKTPSRSWSYTRWHGEKFNNALREHMVNFLTAKDFLAAAPLLQPYYKITLRKEDVGHYSNWSERHVAYVAGLGTFGLSDGFITERGIAHRCGSVITDLELPTTPRTASGTYTNCLFYANGTCRDCAKRCPAGAITEEGHDKVKCFEHFDNLQLLKEKYNVEVTGCGLCQTNVSCEFTNPVRKLKKSTA
jgi:epoxyqueuosine reductase